MEELPQPNPDPIGIPDAILLRPTIVVVFDAVKDTITVVTPVRPEKGVTAKPRSRVRPSASRRSSMRSTAARPCRRQRQGRPAHGVAVLQHHAGRIRAHGARGQGVHRRRRHLPGGAVATLRGAVRAAAVCALSRAAAGQSVALSLFPRLRQVSRSRARARKSWCGRERHGDDPPDRRHAAARRDARTRTRRSRPNCSPTRRNAPSI